MIAIPVRATILYPPCHIKEIGKLIMTANSNIKKAKSSRFVGTNETPVTRRKQGKVGHSPVFGVDPSDYKDKGLREFLAWCGDRYKESELIEVEVYGKLTEQDVGLDIFKDDGGIDADTLKKECNLTFGTAKRLIASYNAWELSKKKVQSIYSGILHVLN